jgi:hypothetical protein
MDRRQRRPAGLAIALVLFLAVVGMFLYGTRSASARQEQEQREILEVALHRSILHCYAIEGRYPESLDYLKTHYGLSYDEDLFYVDYQPLGLDLPPDVTILTVKEGQP